MDFLAFSKSAAAPDGGLPEQYKSRLKETPISRSFYTSSFTATMQPGLPDEPVKVRGKGQGTGALRNSE